MDWVKRYGYVMSRSTIRRGIWQLKNGGFYVRVRTTDPRTGKERAWTRALPLPATVYDAQAVYDELKQKAPDAVLGRLPTSMQWSEFAASHFEGKVQRRELKSAASVARWEDTLINQLIPAFGHFKCEDLSLRDIQAWLNKQALRVSAPPTLIVDGKEVRNTNHLSPRTVNGWLAILKEICVAMTAQLELTRDPAVTVNFLDTSLFPTYTEEEPNSLTGPEAAKFLEAMKELYPRLYAMALMGIALGLRPSSLRPLRREVDIKWTENKILVRRSNTLGEEIMERAKTSNQIIYVPPALTQVLREHVERLDGKAKDSEYLFPSTTGGMLSKSALDVPFKRASEKAGIKIHFTPRGMRRTFKDLAREAEVSDLVSKAVTGHITDQMHERYSTVRPEEMRRDVGKVVSLLQYKQKAG